MKKIYILVLAMCTVYLANAQHTVTGIVSDSNGPLPGVTVAVKGTGEGTTTDFDGRYTLKNIAKDAVLAFSFIGFTTQEIAVAEQSTINVTLQEDTTNLAGIVISSGYERKFKRSALKQANVANAIQGRVSGVNVRKYRSRNKAERKQKKLAEKYSVSSVRYDKRISQDNSSYAKIEENSFKRVQTAPLSTFSIDVDKASYSNVRSMINLGQTIPKDAVKLEEMINYFTYEYPQPIGKHPFAIHTEQGATPWNTDTQLVKIGLQGKEIPAEAIPASNLVFLLDVSGSMSSMNKLPLLKKAFKILVNQLREQDKVSIVVYAGAAGVVLPPTSGIHKEKIFKALDQLEAGGSTAGGEGLELAYAMAKENFLKEGNNRVILATDGDFNVGLSSDQEMEDLIVEKRKSGVFLTCLGFGMGNYKDSKLETLADKGNGNHAYIDSMQEAERVLGKEFGGTLYTIAKDVKIQVEFNPAKVQAYRLIGYENRLLADEDFVDDTKDAGELGSGHTVTALYEIIPVGVESKHLKKAPKLKYTKTTPRSSFGEEVFTVKFRYKKPKANQSIEMVHTHTEHPKTSVSQDFNFAASVAWFGMQLRASKYVENTHIEEIITLSKANKGKDEDGYRSEFSRLMKSYLELQ